jgi:hypothetical protein
MKIHLPLLKTVENEKDLTLIRQNKQLVGDIESKGIPMALRSHVWPTLFQNTTHIN